jgi:hypothetical protein
MTRFPAGDDQHASFGRELVGGNDMEDDMGATDVDVDVDGDGSGAAGGSGDNAAVSHAPLPSVLHHRKSLCAGMSPFSSGPCPAV